MLRIITLSFLLVLFMSCGPEKNTKSTKLPLKTSKTFDAQSGYEIRKMQVNNIEYFYVLNKKNDTIKLWTNDIDFITKEGFKIGTKWNDIPKKLKDSTYKLSGFGYYTELQSGWKLAFCIGKTCTDNYPIEETEVVWIEKQMNKKVSQLNLLQD